MRSISEIIGLFAITMAIGFLVAHEAIKTSSLSFMYSSLSSPYFLGFSYSVDLLLLLIVAVLVVRRHLRYRGRSLFRLLEAIVITVTSFFLVLLLLIIVFRNQIPEYLLFSASLIIALAIALAKEGYKSTKDIATITSSIGIGILLGFSFSFEYVMIGIMLFAVYDYVAVFKTEDMKRLASFFVENDAAFLMSVSEVEAVPSSMLSPEDRKSYLKIIRKTGEYKNPRFAKMLSEGKIPIISHVSLGEGDIALPLTAMVSAYSFLSDYYLAAIVGISAILGVSFTMYMLRRYRRPLPAMPLLFGFMGIASGLYLSLSGIGIGIFPLTLIAAGFLALLLHVRRTLSNIR